MPTVHKNLPNSELHEPKGAASANSDEAFIADGTGSGSFKSLESVISQVYGGMFVNNNTTTSLSITGADFRDDSTYVPLSLDWNLKGGNNVSLDGNTLKVNEGNDYIVHSDLMVKYDVASSIVAFKITVNGTIVSVIPYHKLFPTSGEIQQVCIDEHLFGLNSGDIVGISFSADADGTLDVVDAYVGVSLLGV